MGTTIDVPPTKILLIVPVTCCFAPNEPSSATAISLASDTFLSESARILSTHVSPGAKQATSPQPEHAPQLSTASARISSSNLGLPPSLTWGYKRTDPPLLHWGVEPAQPWTCRSRTFYFSCRLVLSLCRPTILPSLFCRFHPKCFSTVWLNIHFVERAQDANFFSCEDLRFIFCYCCYVAAMWR